MATVTMKASAARQVARDTRALFGRASMEFVIFADNGGRYRWRIVAGDGGTLAQSVSFASYVDAEPGGLNELRAPHRRSRSISSRRLTRLRAAYAIAPVT
jgi:uncharacterized protein YegP (UPF0339 family)